MDKIQDLKLRFKLQMKKQRYDNSGRKQEFIDIAEELFKIVEELQKEIKNIMTGYEDWDLPLNE